jgi:hypothetical protein
MISTVYDPAGTLGIRKYPVESVIAPSRVPVKTTLAYPIGQLSAPAKTNPLSDPTEACLALTTTLPTKSAVRNDTPVVLIFSVRCLTVCVTRGTAGHPP